MIRSVFNTVSNQPRQSLTVCVLAVRPGSSQSQSLYVGMIEAVLWCSAGVPPTQLHRYGSLGCVDLAAVLEPLDFLLPQREAVPPASEPELDISGKLSSLTFEPQLTEPETDPDLSLDPAQTQSGITDSEVTEPRSEEPDEETIQDEEFSLD